MTKQKCFQAVDSFCLGFSSNDNYYVLSRGLCGKHCHSSKSEDI